MFYYVAEYNQLGNKIHRSDNTLANQDGHVLDQHNDPHDPNVSAPPSEAPLPAGYTPAGVDGRRVLRDLKCRRPAA